MNNSIKVKRWLLVCLCMLYMPLAWSQHNISGVVTDTYGDPLPGVSVKVKGTMHGTATDANGAYSLQAPNENAVLVFSFIGFTVQEIPVSNRSTIHVTLSEDVQQIEEVVVIGYGAVAKRDLTGAVSTVKPKELTAFTVSDPIHALQGLVPGVQISQNTGDPSGDYSIRIRGVNSIRGDNTPLYIIDGIPSSTSTISTYDIESMEVLKDASATAIYGSRGANGVVMITTKKGKAGKTNVSYDFEYGIQSQIKKFDMMDAQTWARFQNMFLVNSNTMPEAPFSESDIAAMGKGTDWQDLMFKDAPISSHNLSITGGADNVKYFVSASAMQRDGMIYNSSFNKYNIRSNLDMTISPMIDASLQLGYTNTEYYNQTDGGLHNGASMISAIYSAYPIFTPFDDNGNYADLRSRFAWSSHEILNPMMIAYETSKRTVTNTVNVNASVEFKPFKGLSLKSIVGLQNSNPRYDAYTTTKYIYSNNSASVSASRSTSVVNENILNYTLTLNNAHKFDVMGAFTYQQADNVSLSASGNTFFSDILYTYALNSAGTINTPSTGYTKWVLMSYLGRINYSFKGKYLATVSFRADGSSRYSPGQRWGYFPSGALAWRISDESFMESLTSFLSDMKIRIGYGETGSTAINPYFTQNLLTAGKTATGNGNYTYYAPSATYSGELKWETTAQWDIGLDIGLLKQRIRITADYYQKFTRDLLNTVYMPTSTGYTQTTKNIGSMSNKGIELFVDADIIRKQDFGFTAQFNIFHNKNRIEELAGGDDILGATYNSYGSGPITILREGEPMGAFYLYKFAGLDANGRLSYVDLNEDGQYTDNADRYLAGSPHPKFTYGLNIGLRYKNWDFNFFLQGSQGNKVYNMTEGMNYNSWSNRGKHVYEQSWKDGQDNSNAKYPRLESTGTIRYSDRFLEDASYLRLKNIQLAYNFPCNTWKTNSWLQGIRLFISAQDYLTLTKYSGLNPEVSSKGGDINGSIDHNTYPATKRLSFGLKVQF